MLNGSVFLTLDFLERVQLSWSRKARQLVPDIATDTNGTRKQRIQVADCNVLGEVLDPRDSRTSSLDSIGGVLDGEDQERCELCERGIDLLRLDIRALAHCCAGGLLIGMQ